MSQQWYFMKDRKRQGPVAAEKLAELARLGQLSQTDLVRKEGEFRWVAASSIDGIFTTDSQVPVQPKPSGPFPLPRPPGRLLNDEEIREEASKIWEHYEDLGRSKDETFLLISAFIRERIHHAVVTYDDTLSNFGQEDLKELVRWLNRKNPDY